MKSMEIITHSEPTMRFAIVGCGLIGKKRFDALPKHSLVAACDLDINRATALAAKAGPQCIATTEIDKALDARPDAVIVASTNSHLAPLASACIRAGKHILVEKPVAMSTKEIDELQSLALLHGVRVRTGYNHRYHAAFLKAREILDSANVGPLMFIRARYGHGGRVGYDREWRANPELSGGGELMDQGVHLIDLAGSFLGSWESVEGHIATYFWDMPVDDNAFLNLRNASGNTAWLHVSCTEWKNQFSFEIYTKYAKLHIEGLGGTYGVERLHYYQMLPEMGPPETLIYEFPRGDNSWNIETNEFIQDILLGREPVPGLKQARAALKVVETIYGKAGVGRHQIAVAGL
jgi:predicted dehydrogenase